MVEEINTGTERHLTPEDYRDHWQQVIDRLQDMNHVINSNIRDMEQQYLVFDKLYKAVIQDIDILSSLYSSYNSIEGREYILRLRALLQSYRERYTTEGIDFTLIDRLIGKISALRDKSISNFPALHHEEPAGIEKEGILPEYREHPFRWLTFSRNRSWFITPYRVLDHVNIDAFKIEDISRDHVIEVSIEERRFEAEDLLPKPSGKIIAPKIIIIIDEGRRCYAADSVGQKVYATEDIIMPLVKGFHVKHELSPGRVRFMGRNHIFIKDYAFQ